MAASKLSSKPNPFTVSFIILSISLLLLTINYLRRLQIQYPKRVVPGVIKNPIWYDVISKQNFDGKVLKVGLVNLDGGLLHGVENSVNIGFAKVSNDIVWKDLFPEWINENGKVERCPKIPMPKYEDYDDDFDVVVAKLSPCLHGLEKGKGVRDVFRLQVNLVMANLLVRSGYGGHRVVYGVFIGGGCSPMSEIFRCDDLIWHEGDVWIYKPDLRRLNEIVSMPVGSCHLAPPFLEHSGQEGRDKYLPREAYVTVLHSSEAYVCGAIALAQSIIRSNSTKDLILLADDSISQKSQHGLESAGWKIKRIERIQSPNARKKAYNEWNYSKLRLWQLIDYDKIIFIDSDLILLKNIDEFFNYPQLSARGNNKVLFNSGVMLIEPSQCTFETLMEQRSKIISYNGGDQGFLNEIFTWWHRWPASINHMKYFDNSKSVIETRHRVIPKNVYALHYLGLKPWMCYQDYDCNWDREIYHQFASDVANEKWWDIYKSMPENLKSYCRLTPKMDARIKKWRGKAKKASFVDGHWKLKVRDPRRLSKSLLL